MDYRGPIRVRFALLTNRRTWGSQEVDHLQTGLHSALLGG